ncbi:MAG: hypothetical protein JNM41_03360 [Flavipsychrobacter sp.]|nr:hypothetical protein [Flavipsychrobacter sp.]
MKKEDYITVDIDTAKKDGTRIKRKVRFKSMGTTLFFNNLHHLVDLTPKAFSFYIYICQGMDKKNVVLIDGKFKENYVEFITKVTSKQGVCTVSSLDKYLSQLKDIGLLLLIGSSHSALYLVNPKFVFNGTEPARKRLLKDILESRINKGLSIKHLIGVSEDDFFNGL